MPVTHRVIKKIAILLISLIFSGCSMIGDDQVGGYSYFSFGSSMVCETVIKEIQFQNDLDEAVWIMGIGISPGTDPNGNFNLKSVVINGSEEITVGSGTIRDVSIPPKASYVVNVAFTPRELGAVGGAILDIVYSAPSPGGVIQVELSGDSEGENISCVQTSEGAAVNYDGEYQLALLKMIAVIESQQYPMSTEDTPEAGYDPYSPFILDITLDKAAGTLSAPQILLEDGFFLPPSEVYYPTLKSVTSITTNSLVTGTYDSSTGNLSVELSLRLDTTDSDALSADISASLYTQGVEIPPGVSPSKLSSAGVEFGDNFIPGQPVDPETGEGILVAGSIISGAGGTLGSVVNNLGVVVWIQFQLCELDEECPSVE